MGAVGEDPRPYTTRRTVRATQHRGRRGTRGRPPRAGQRPSTTTTTSRREPGGAAVLLRYAAITVGAIVVMVVVQRLAQS